MRFQLASVSGPGPPFGNAAGDVDGLRLRRFSSEIRTNAWAVSGRDGPFRAQSFKSLFQVVAGSKSTVNESDSGTEKLSFSMPITRPARFFISTISLPVSSQTYSPLGLSNQTVESGPRGREKSLQRASEGHLAWVLANDEVRAGLATSRAVRRPPRRLDQRRDRTQSPLPVSFPPGGAHDRRESSASSPLLER
jgi:hypothetical protein